MNYGRFAFSYNFFEKLIFWRSLENARFCYLDRLSTCSHVLLIGEGDGRFLKKLVLKFPKTKVDCIEISERMIKNTKSKIKQLKNINFIQSDVLNTEIESQYDAVITMFFLDNFSYQSNKRIISKIETCLKKNGIWLNTDFYIHKKGLKQLISSLLINLLYFIFRFLTNVEGKRIYPSETITTLKLEENNKTLFLTSELYRKRYE